MHRNYLGVLVLAVAILLLAAGLLSSTRDSVTPEGCYVITDELGVQHRSTRVPQYNVQVGAVSFQTSTGEGQILKAVSIQADYACLDANPAPTPETGNGS